MGTPKYFFGAKALVFYDRSSFVPVGIFRVLSTAEFTSEVEKLPLVGGHRNGPWAIEAGEPTYGLTATLMEFPDFAFTELDNATKTVTTGEDLTGFVGVIANKSGTSVSDATTGIASVAAIAGSEAKLPLGRVVIAGTAVAGEVDIYLAGDVATGSIPVVNELPLLAAGVVVPGTGGTVQIADYGIEITGGSGAIAFTDGDSAFLETRPANSITTKIIMPDNSCIKTLGCVLVWPKNAQGEQSIVDFPKVAVAGTSFSANTREYAEFELTASPMIDEDSEINGLYEMTRITTPTSC